MKQFWKGRAGFTLVEVLIAVSLIAVLGVAVTGSLLQGSKIYRRFSDLSGREQLSFFYEKLNRDVRNAYRCTDSEPSFSAEAIAFATHRPEADGPSLDPGPALRVTYRFLEGRHCLIRSESVFPYSQDIKTDEWLLPERHRAIFDFMEVSEGLPPFVAVRIESMDHDGAFIQDIIEIPSAYVAKE